MVKTEVFDTFLRKSIVMVDFDPYFLVQFPYRNRGIFKEKYCNGRFWHLFLAPYRNMVKIEVFHTFSKEKY